MSVTGTKRASPMPALPPVELLVCYATASVVPALEVFRITAPVAARSPIAL
jgi:hypothetical protein